jgi:membrane protein
LLEKVKSNPIVRTAQAVSDRYARDSGGYMSAAIAYYGFLSLFPLLLLALSIVGFVLAGRPGLQENVAESIGEAVPGLSTLIGENLDSLVMTRTGVGVVALAGLLWTGMGVAGAARNALRRIFRQPLPLGIVQDKVWLLLKTIGLGVLALVATGLAGVVANVEGEGPVGIVLVVGVPVVTLALDFALFLAAYRTLMKGRPGWRSVAPGAMFAAIGWTVLKLVGAWYASRTVANSSGVYGAFATTVGVLVLLYLSGRLFVYGAELNAVLMERGEEAGPEGNNPSVRGGGSVETERNGPVPQPRGRPEGRSTADLVKAIGSDAALLVRKEIELAKQEVKEGVTSKLLGAVFLTIAGVFGLFALGFLATAGARALGLVLPLWAGFLIVGGAFLLAAGVGALVGVRMLKQSPVAPVQTKETIKEDVEWARAALKR